MIPKKIPLQTYSRGNALFRHNRRIIPVQGLNSSLRLVLARVLASTRLTMTAQ